MRRAFTLIELIVVVATVGVSAAIVLPVFNRTICDDRGGMCQSNLKQIGLGFLQYVQDNSERFPPARVGAIKGWGHVLKPYLKSAAVFQCPSGPRHAVKLSTDYFYNRHLSRVSVEKILEPQVTILGGDGADDSPYWNSITQLPAAWMVAYPAPSVRHYAGTRANYLFVDGHVKRIGPSNIKTELPVVGSDVTLAIR
ncbi:prepilin-type N-terminal cleavage/methylation domain-containing protein [bacterium]|nr:MAG: prepilin-type N-terminal cleavage/methylation domain-containing protein [bacterium]